MTEKFWAPVVGRLGLTHGGMKAKIARFDETYSPARFWGEVNGMKVAWYTSGRAMLTNLIGFEPLELSGLDLVGEWPEAVPAVMPSVDIARITVGDDVEIGGRYTIDAVDSLECGLPYRIKGPTGRAWIMPDMIRARFAKPELAVTEGSRVVTRDGIVGTAGKPMDGVVLVKSEAYSHPVAWPVDMLQVQRPGQVL